MTSAQEVKTPLVQWKDADRGQGNFTVAMSPSVPNFASALGLWCTSDFLRRLLQPTVEFRFA